MRIESLRLKNYKNFRDVVMRDIPSFCVVVGANGSGKSTLFDVFGFLRDCLTHNVRKALEVRGRFHEVLSRGVEPSESIEIEVQFRMPIAEVERLVTYRLEIGLEGNFPVIRHEVLRYKRGRYGSPYHFLDFSNGEAMPSPTRKTSTSRTKSCSVSTRVSARMCLPSRGWASLRGSRPPTRFAS